MKYILWFEKGTNNFMSRNYAGLQDNKLILFKERRGKGEKERLCLTLTVVKKTPGLFLLWQ